MAHSFILFYVVTILFHCYGINGQQVEKEPKVSPQIDGKPIPHGGYLVQQITTPIYVVGTIFFSSPNTLLYSYSKVNGFLMHYDIKTGETERRYIKELAKEKFATVTPTKKDPKKLIIGSDLNLRLLEIKDKEYTISEPLVTFKHEGFLIHAAHADDNGILFILLISRDPTIRLAKFYKVQNKTATLLKEYKKGPRDFRFNQECNKIFMIYEMGRKIYSLSYNLKTTELGNDPADVFDMDEHRELKGHDLRSVVLDRKPGNVWAIAAGKTGYLLEINPNNKTLVDITPLPIKDLTFMTFGNQDYKALYIGSERTCVKTKGQGSIYGVTGINREGVTDKPVAW